MADAFLGNRRVLVVEEDQAVRDLLCDVYDFWGARVSLGAADGLALTAADLARHDLVVLSWDFQAASPRRVLSHIDSLRPAGPGLVITTARGAGSGPVPARLGGKKLPIIVKPFGLEALRMASRAALVNSWMARTDAAGVHQLARPILPTLLATAGGVFHDVA